MARPSKHSPALRRRAIAEVIERDRKIPEVARDLGDRLAGDFAELGQAGTSARVHTSHMAQSRCSGVCMPE